MKFPKIGQVVVILLAAIGMQSCGQESGSDQSAPVAADTAVHDAEVATGELGDVLARGEALYLTNCAACHQPGGQGLTGAFPPLAQSDFLAGNRQEVMTTALFGRSGPIT